MTYFRKNPNFVPPMSGWFDTSFKHATPTTTLTDVPGVGMKVAITGSNSNEQRCTAARSTANWGTAYRVRSRIDPTLSFSNYPGWGMGFYDSGSGKASAVTLYGQGATFEYAVGHYSNITTWAGNASIIGGQNLTFNWFELERNGATIYFRVSGDGQNWNTFSEATTAYLPVAPTHIFIVFNTGPASFSTPIWGGLITYWDDPDYPIASRLT